MKVSIGADHAGFDLKELLKKHISDQGIQVLDEGTISNESVDYPDFARKVAHDVSEKKVDYGVLVCGSGIGMAITANKVAGIRAANVASEYEARMSREHNDANVIAIGSRVLKQPEAFAIVDTFLNTAFAHGRHTARVEKITEIEHEEALQTAKLSAS